MKIRDRLKMLEDNAVNAATSTALATKADKIDLTTLQTTVTSVKTISNKAAADILVNKTSSDAIGARVGVLEVIPTGTTSEVIAKSTNIRRWTPNMLNQSILAINSDSRVVAEWSTTRAYKTDEHCLLGGVQYRAVVDNTGKSPLTDSASWTIYNPTEANDIISMRSPTKSDIYSAGRIWRDQSFGKTTSLNFLSTGNGGWIALNRIALTAIRVYAQGYVASYTTLNSIRLMDKSGTIYPMSSWIIGGTTGSMSCPPQGTPYTGQSTSPGVNAQGTVDLIPIGAMDLTKGFSGGMANFRADKSSTGITRVDLIYSNGGSRTFTCSSGATPGTDITFLSGITAEFQYGSSVDAALGQNLDIATLGDSNSLVYGRISGQVLNQILAPYLARITSLEARLQNAGIS